MKEEGRPVAAARAVASSPPPHRPGPAPGEPGGQRDAEHDLDRSSSSMTHCIIDDSMRHGLGRARQGWQGRKGGQAGRVEEPLTERQACGCCPRPGVAWPGVAGLGTARQAWRGGARLGKAWPGSARQARPGEARLGLARPGAAWRGKARKTGRPLANGWPLPVHATGSPGRQGDGVAGVAGVARLQVNDAPMIDNNQVYRGSGDPGISTAHTHAHERS